MKGFRFLAAAVAVAAAVAPPVAAAPSYDGCTSTIVALPAVISTQGTWCLKSDLATAITTGNAITIDANNVTLDCNGFKVGGLAAGLSTQTAGIVSPSNRLNSVVRDCTVRGFHTGIATMGDGGLIEDNRLEGNTNVGIQTGSGSVVRRNLVIDTGGAPGQYIYGIRVEGATEVSGNRIDGTVSGSDALIGGTGIYAYGADGLVVRDNIVSALHKGSGLSRPIVVYEGPRALVSGNVINGSGSAVATYGISCAPSGLTIVRGNTVIGYTSEDTNCDEAGTNYYQ